MLLLAVTIPVGDMSIGDQKMGASEASHDGCFWTADLFQVIDDRAPDDIERSQGRLQRLG